MIFMFSNLVPQQLQSAKEKALQGKSRLVRQCVMLGETLIVITRG